VAQNRLELLALIRGAFQWRENVTDRSEPKRKVRLIVDLTEEELVAIDDYRFATRCPSRAAAVRELLKIGMTSKRPTRPSSER
jgi:hypothetical protein